MKTRIAKFSGYCFGVKRALEITETILAKNKNRKVYSIGQIIHNKGVIEELKKKGLIIVDSIEEIEPLSIFIVRSHGMSPELIKKIKSKNVKVIDTACPFVKRAQSKAKMLSRRGFHLVIIGDKNHPEVLSIVEHAGKSNLTVVSDSSQVKNMKKYEKIGVIMQTTQIKENAKLIIGELIDKAREVLVENTICNITEKRQKITADLSKEVDLMLIVGGKNSANTTHLHQISSQYNPQTYHIENYSEINKGWFKNKNITAGISGGASTPDKDINAVADYIEKLYD